MRNFERGLNPAGAARQLVAIPTLVIHGDADALVPLAAGVDTAEQVPGAELLVLEGMGHALPMRLWPGIAEGIRRVARWAAGGQRPMAR